jgi:hypothetical protein
VDAFCAASAIDSRSDEISMIFVVWLLLELTFELFSKAFAAFVQLTAAELTAGVAF